MAEQPATKRKAPSSSGAGGSWHGVPKWLLAVGGGLGAYLVYLWWSSRSSSTAATTTASTAPAGTAGTSSLTSSGASPSGLVGSAGGGYGAQNNGLLEQILASLQNVPSGTASTTSSGTVAPTSTPGTATGLSVSPGQRAGLAPNSVVSPGGDVVVSGGYSPSTGWVPGSTITSPSGETVVDVGGGAPTGSQAGSYAANLASVQQGEQAYWAQPGATSQLSAASVNRLRQLGALPPA